MVNLKIIIDSTRPGRAADHVVPWITGLAKQHTAFTVGVLDLRDWPLPFFAETVQTVGDPRDPSYSDPLVRRWNQRIAEGDAYLFVTPEYNHSVPSVLKNAIDSVFASFAFRHKPAAFVGYSGGISAGVRAIEHLAPPADQDTVSMALNIRVADIQAVYHAWRARGAEFLTPPQDRDGEIRCYLRDPDGYLIEVGQTTRA
jgi:NAD(P)H-dependent FMN reductase